MICHGIYQTLPDQSVKIFPQGVGQKLSPKIPQYFPDYIRFTQHAEKRTLQLNSDTMIDLANSRPNALPKELSADRPCRILRDPTCAPRKLTYPSRYQTQSLNIQHDQR